jgi:hypothetical protein
MSNRYTSVGGYEGDEEERCAWSRGRFRIEQRRVRLRGAAAIETTSVHLSPSGLSLAAGGRWAMGDGWAAQIGSASSVKMVQAGCSSGRVDLQRPLLLHLLHPKWHKWHARVLPRDY